MSRTSVTRQHDCARHIGLRIIMPLLAAVLCMGGQALGGSIFDEDYVPPAPRTVPPEAAGLPVAPMPATRPSSLDLSPPDTSSEPSAVRPAGSATVRLAVPTPAEQARSRKLFKEVFAEDLKDRSSSGRLLLASKLLAIVDKTTDNPADRFVLLIGARDAAAEGGDFRLSSRAAESAASLYDVNAARLTADAFLKGPLKATTPALASDDLQVGLELEGALTASDDYLTATRVLTALQPLAAGNPATAPVVKDRGKQLAEMRLFWERAESAREQLKKNATDPAANAVVGEFLCFVKGDFDNGLPFLTKSSDPAMRAAATGDLAGGSAPTQQMAIGDGWWDAAEKAVRERFKSSMQRRAVLWYQEALVSGEVKGLRHALLEQRIAAVPPSSDGGHSTVHAGATGPAVASVNSELALITRKFNDKGEWDIKQGVWTIANGRIRGEGDCQLEFKTPLPSDCMLSFRMNVVSGMRPRIHLNNTGIMFGNEGYSTQLYPHGGKNIEGAAFPYANGQALAVSIRFTGEHFQIDIDGKQAFKGERKQSESIRLALSAGDGWSRGTTEFWDFKLEK